MLLSSAFFPLRLVGFPDIKVQGPCVFCDELISIPKSGLLDYIGSLSKIKLIELDAALKIALAVESDFDF